VVSVDRIETFFAAAETPTMFSSRKMGVPGPAFMPTTFTTAIGPLGIAPLPPANMHL